MAAPRKNYTVSYEGGLNLRQKPSKDAKILALLSPDTKVVIDPKAETPEGWYAVATGGYVMSEYLK